MSRMLANPHSRWQSSSLVFGLGALKNIPKLEAPPKAPTRASQTVKASWFGWIKLNLALACSFRDAAPGIPVISAYCRKCYHSRMKSWMKGKMQLFHATIIVSVRTNITTSEQEGFRKLPCTFFQFVSWLMFRTECLGMFVRCDSCGLSWSNSVRHSDRPCIGSCLILCPLFVVPFLLMLAIKNAVLFWGLRENNVGLLSLLFSPAAASAGV